METSSKEEKRAKSFLQSKGVKLNEITGFYFMKRHLVDPEKHNQSNLYGPGLLTLELQTGEEKVVILHLRNHPTSVIRTLLAAGIPFKNHQELPKTSMPQPTKRYHRTSLYMIWYFALFIVCLGFGFYFTTQTANPYRIYLSLPFFGYGLYALYLLQARFCYLRLDEQSLTIFSAGRSIRYPYQHLTKVNFDFAREPNATHIMEVLDKDYRYRLFYIGRTPRKSLNEITERLKQAGVDTTCSLNDEKKHYNDVYHAQ